MKFRFTAEHFTSVWPPGFEAQSEASKRIRDILNEGFAERANAALDALPSETVFSDARGKVWTAHRGTQDTQTATVWDKRPLGETK